MADISIQRLNDVYLQLKCEPSIHQELNEHFSFEAPGARFHPLVRAKKWDGKIRLYHFLSGTIYVGLKSYVEHFCEVNNYTIDFNNWDDRSDKVTRDDINKFCQSLNLSLPDGQSIRDYQLDAIYRAIKDGRRLLLSPTGSGKSLIIYCLLRWHEQYGRKQLILVPTTSLVEQMYSDFQAYSKNNGWKASYNCSRIYSGQGKNSDMPVTISTWQSVYTLPKQFFQDFKVIYGDEAHLFKAKSLVSILHKMTDTPYRYGTTGTLDGAKCLCGNTFIHTSKGKKKIKDIEPGDLVMSFNERTNVFEYQPVVQKFANGIRKKMLKITTNTCEIIATPEHKFYTKNRGWVEAKHLTEDDELLQLQY